MERLKIKAISLGAIDFGLSNRKTKRFYVVVPINGFNKTFHFGSKNGHSYIFLFRRGILY